MTIQKRGSRHSGWSLGLVLLLLFCPLLQTVGRSQTSTPPAASDQPVDGLSQILRLETLEVGGGAQLITVKARLDGLQTESVDKWVPLVSILRDTLGDANRENDRLRYVWPLTYTRPTLKQRFAAAIPFF